MVFVEDPWSRIVGVHWGEEEEPGGGGPPGYLGRCESGILPSHNLNYVYFNASHSAFAGFAGTYINPHACCPPLPDGFNGDVFPPTYNEGYDFIPGNGATHLRITMYSADVVEGGIPGELWMNAWVYPQTNPYNPPILYRARAPDHRSQVTIGTSQLVVEIDAILPANNPRNPYGHTIIFSYSGADPLLPATTSARAFPPTPVPPSSGVSFIVEHNCPAGSTVPLVTSGLPPVIMPRGR